jgi:hypothetical protein
MQRFSFILAVILTVALTGISTGCDRVASSINGSGNIIDKGMQVTAFTDINIEGAFTAEIVQSDNLSVTISTDDNLMNRVNVSIKDNTLHLSIQAPTSFFPSGLKAKITMPNIRGLVLAESAKASLSGFRPSTAFTSSLNSGSSLNGYLETDFADFVLRGESQVNLKGKINKFQLECLDKSKAELGDLVLSSANVRVAGESTATLQVNGRFDMVLIEKSKIYYLGTPAISNTTISSDSILTAK